MLWTAIPTVPHRNDNIWQIDSFRSGFYCFGQFARHQFFPNEDVDEVVGFSIKFADPAHNVG